MATIFSKIISGEIPSRMIFEDELCVSFLDVRPIEPGHALVVPRKEIDQWTDLPKDLAGHLMSVAHQVGNAQKKVFDPQRIGLMIAGFEVPHAHIHVIPADSMAQFDFKNAVANPDATELDQNQADLRAELG